MRRVLAVAAASLMVFGACGGDGGGDPGTPVGESETPAGPVTVESGAPPWPLGSGQAARMVAAGITGLQAEGQKVHYHAHLDVFYEGEKVKVPTNIGIDLQARLISPLHTHSESGVIHVEAEVEEDFTLGQFFTQWGVKAGNGCIADKCADEAVAFVDGAIYDGDPSQLVIKPDTQIALVLGTTRPDDIPSGYDCDDFPKDACPKTPNP